MGYNKKQYDAAETFLATKDDNITDAGDQKRIAAYDLYENLYINSSKTLELVLRGEDTAPILMPSGKKIVEATNRFLGVNLDYFVEPQGDEGTQQKLDIFFADFFKREAVVTKFNSSKRWGLIRGDGCLMISGNPNKAKGSRLSLAELDPRQLFEIEDPNDSTKVIGVHLVEAVSDFREPDKPNKLIAKRRTFRKVFNELGDSIGVTSELTYWEIGKWDDRNEISKKKMERVPNAELDEEEEFLPASITQLPVYKWTTRAPQNSTWGHSILTGLETLLYAINQSLSDEDATIVFQGLGMYVTNAGPPRDPATGQVGSWTFGPKQVIEIGQDQKFERVTGITDVAAFTEHMTFMDEKGLSESSGTPEVAIGRVDVAIAESGISLQLQMMPLISSNAELEIVMIDVIDHLFHDITTMWLPAYEPEEFGDVNTMAECNVSCLFDDPMPKNRDAEIQETVLLDSSGLILKSMAVAKLRDLGWKYPTVTQDGTPLTDDDIAQMLMDQASQVAAAADPYGAMFGGDSGDGTTDDNTPDNQTVDLGVTS